MKQLFVKTFFLFIFILLCSNLELKANDPIPVQTAIPMPTPESFSTEPQPVSTYVPISAPLPANPVIAPMPYAFMGCSVSSSIVNLPPENTYICGGECTGTMTACTYDKASNTCGLNCASAIEQFYPESTATPNFYDQI